MFAIVSANLRRSPARTAATALGIAVGVGMIVALLSFTQGLRETAAGFVHLGGSDLGIFQANVSDPTASLLPDSMVGRVAASPDVAAATPLVLIVEGLKSDESAIVFGAQPSGFFTRNLVVVAGHSPRRPRRRCSSGIGSHPSSTSPSARRSRSAATASPSAGSTTPGSCSRTPGPWSPSLRRRRSRAGPER